MPKLVARCITISLDGFSAAKGQALDAPFGKDGLRLMRWAHVTKYFATMIGKEGGAEGLDNDFLTHAFDNIGASIMGRNMFGPQRGHWPRAGRAGGVRIRPFTILSSYSAITSTRASRWKEAPASISSTRASNPL
jgi:dihydrofolate reductase